MEYLQFGNKIVPIDRMEELGGKKIPVIQATAEEILYPSGRKDVIIHVPLLKIENKLN